MTIELLLPAENKMRRRLPGVDLDSDTSRFTNFGYEIFKSLAGLKINLSSVLCLLINLEVLCLLQGKRLIGEKKLSPFRSWSIQCGQG